MPLLAGPAVLDSMSPTGNPLAWKEFTLVQTRLGRSLALPQTNALPQADSFAVAPFGIRHSLLCPLSRHTIQTNCSDQLFRPTVECRFGECGINQW